MIDFPDSFLHPLRWAIQEAVKHNLHVSVLYTYRLDQLRKDNVVQSKKAIDQKATELFDSLAAGLLRDSHVSFDFRSEVGFIHDRIREHATKNNVALLVIGKELAGAESFQELVDETEVPVVIVPSKKL